MVYTSLDHMHAWIAVAHAGCSKCRRCARTHNARCTVHRCLVMTPCKTLRNASPTNNVDTMMAHARSHCAIAPSNCTATKLRSSCYMQRTLAMLAMCNTGVGRRALCAVFCVLLRCHETYTCTRRALCRQRAG